MPTDCISPFYQQPGVGSRAQPAEPDSGQFTSLSSKKKKSLAAAIVLFCLHREKIDVYIDINFPKMSQWLARLQCRVVKF